MKSANNFVLSLAVTSGGFGSRTLVMLAGKTHRITLHLLLVLGLILPEAEVFATSTVVRLSPTNIASSGVIVRVLGGRDDSKLFRIIVTPSAAGTLGDDWKGRLEVSDGKKVVLDCRIARERLTEEERLTKRSIEVPMPERSKSVVFEFEISVQYVQSSRFYLIVAKPELASVFAWDIQLKDFVDKPRSPP